MRLNRNTISSPVSISVALLIAGILVIGSKFLLVDPMNRAEVLSREMVILRERNKASQSSRASVSSDIQQIIEKAKQFKPTSETKWIEERLIRLGKKLEGIASSEIEQRDALAFIAAEREQIKLIAGINSGFLQALGSGFILVTAFVALRNLRLAQKNLEISENKLTSEIIAKATDHLGSETPIVRLAGINTLIWIARSLITKQEKVSVATIENTIAGFIVNRSQSDKADALSSLPIDIETALNFLLQKQKHAQDQPSGQINLASSQFSLRRLHGVCLVNINLQNSSLSGSDLKRSSILDCNLSLADLSSSDLSSCEVKDSQFSISILENAIVTEAKFVNCTFTRAKFGSSFDFSRVQAISEIDFSLAELQCAIFDGLDLCGIKFNGTDLTGASFRQCKLENVVFDNAILNGAILDNAKAGSCSFSGADLAEVSLQAVELENVDLRGAKFDARTT